jgi:outer membrane biosynthesis protein TonB
MADVKYPDYTPVDEPTVKPKPAPKTSKPKPAPKPVMYPDSVPVDEPVKKMAKGGSASSRADGCAERGKTKGTMVMCGGGMARGKK